MSETTAEVPADTPADTSGDTRGNALLNRVPYIIGLIVAGYFVKGSLDLGIGGFAEPDSGLWPLIVALVLVGCCLVGLVVADGTDVDTFGARLRRPALGLAVLLLFALLFPVVGLLLTGTLVLILWFRFLANEPWPISVALAVGATVVAYVLFVQLLGAVFPPDVIAQLWGDR
jgi:hypothetical protein